MIAYKVTTREGGNFHGARNTVIYRVGETVEAEDCDGPEKGACGRGLHVSPTPLDAVHYVRQMSEREDRPWRYFEVDVADHDVIARDATKLRVRRLRVVREMALDEVIGERLPKLRQAIEMTRAEIASWKSIQWYRPEDRVPDELIEQLVTEWHDRITPWAQRRGAELPLELLIIRTASAEAAGTAYAAAGTAYAAAYADADTADTAYAAAYADTADTADTAYAAAAEADTAAASAAYDAGTADASAWWHWYVRPHYTLLRSARWILWRGDSPNPWQPIVDMYRLGCLPMGYRTIDGVTAFVVYVPEVKP